MSGRTSAIGNRVLLALLLVFTLSFATSQAWANPGTSLSGNVITALGEDGDPVDDATSTSFDDLDVYVFDTYAEADEGGYMYSISDQVFAGESVKPELKVAVAPKDGANDPESLAVLQESDDYSIDFSNNDAVGDAVVTITGSGNYSGTVTRTFRIVGQLGNSNIAAISAKVYTGAAIKPAPVVTFAGVGLRSGTDFVVSYKNNVKAGTASVIVEGNGYYQGTATRTFTIKKASVAKAAIAKIAAKVYTGAAIKPTPTVKLGKVTLKKGTDYTLAYSKNKNVGTAKVTIKGKGSCVGSKTVKFTIKKAPISKAKVASIAAKTYSGKAFTPNPTVKYNSRKLKKGASYTLSYKANVKAGTAKVVIRGKGNFKGTKTVKFKIKRASISKASVSGVSSYGYSGYAIKPSPTLTFGGKTLLRGSDYSISYDDNVYVGRASITIKGKGNFQGTRTRYFYITKPSGGGVVYITNTGEKYHRGSCRWLQWSKIATTRYAAEYDGYTPCKVCRP